MKRLFAVLLMILPLLAVAEGPDYEKGTGVTHGTSCTPPTHRAANVEGVAVPLTNEELDFASVSLYTGGDLFNAGTLVAGPVKTDIFCANNWRIDAYPTGQYYVFATITDTGGRTSEISVEGGPFSSSLPLMAPGAPTGVK